MLSGGETICPSLLVNQSWARLNQFEIITFPAHGSIILGWPMLGPTDCKIPDHFALHKHLDRHTNLVGL